MFSGRLQLQVADSTVPLRERADPNQPGPQLAAHFCTANFHRTSKVLRVPASTCPSIAISLSVEGSLCFHLHNQSCVTTINCGPPFLLVLGICNREHLSKQVNTGTPPPTNRDQTWSQLVSRGPGQQRNITLGAIHGYQTKCPEYLPNIR
jgi:hypothetical protein